MIYGGNFAISFVVRPRKRSGIVTTQFRLKNFMYHKHVDLADNLPLKFQFVLLLN